MTAGDRAALEALNCRIDHTVAIARIVSRSADQPELADAVRGIAETLSEVAGRIDRIIKPAASAA